MKTTPIGTISIVKGHPMKPYEIRVDQRADASTVVRAPDLLTAAEMMALALEFDMWRFAGINAPQGAMAAAWRKLAAKHRNALRIADGDHSEARVELDGKPIDPNGKWCARRPHDMPTLQAV